MTVLSACQQAAVKLNQTSPSSVFSSTADFPAQLALAANEAAEAIVEAHDWQKLRTLATISGDASTTSFALPVDYNRMLKKAVVHSATWQGAQFFQAKDEDNWLYINDIGITGTPGTWIILGGRFQVFPAMPVGETARFYYISSKYVQGSGGTQTSFTADADTFLLSEKLLRLGIVWRWLSDRKMEYSEAMSNFEIALGEEIGKDKGSNILTVGRVRLPTNVNVAYPGIIVP